MRKIRVVLLFGSIGVLLAACSSSLVSKATDNTGVATTLAGTTLPATTVVATTLGGTTLPDTTVAATTVGESTPAATVPLTLAPTDDSTSPPVATTPPTTAKTTQKTSAKTTTTTAKTTPPTSASGPVFASFSVSADNCPSTTVAPGVSFVVVPPKPTVKVSWKITGPFDMIYDAVDNVDGANSSGLPATGSETFSRDCNGSHTYYVVAVNKGHKTVKSKVVSSG